MDWAPTRTIEGTKAVMWYTWMRPEGWAPAPPADIPAITPYLNPDKPALPAFTADDAITYIAGNPGDELERVQKFTRLHQRLVRLHPSGPSTVAKVQFVTGAQADQLLDTAIGLGPDVLVCVVELHGRFMAHWNIQERSDPESIRSGLFMVLYMMFDARTGNFRAFHAPFSSLRLPSPPTGGPAITPRRDSVPSYTEQDVRDYFSSREHPDRAGVLSQQTITQIVFTTIRELDLACGGGRYFAANYGEDTPICYVELSGTFHARGGLGHARTGQPPKTFDTSGLVFDARTGNFYSVVVLGRGATRGTD